MPGKVKWTTSFPCPGTGEAMNATWFPDRGFPDRGLLVLWPAAEDTGREASAQASALEARLEGTYDSLGAAEQCLSDAVGRKVGFVKVPSPNPATRWVDMGKVASMLLWMLALGIARALQKPFTKKP